MKHVIIAAMLAFTTSAALAEEPVSLSEAQMDPVTAGGSVDVSIQGQTGGTSQTTGGPTIVDIRVINLPGTEGYRVIPVVIHPTP
jgi:hypothetical protein